VRGAGLWPARAARCAPVAPVLVMRSDPARSQSVSLPTARTPAGGTQAPRLSHQRASAPEPTKRPGAPPLVTGGAGQAVMRWRTSACWPGTHTAARRAGLLGNVLLFPGRSHTWGGNLQACFRSARGRRAGGGVGGGHAHDEQAVRAAGVRVDVVAADRALLEAARHDALDLLRRLHACARAPASSVGQLRAGTALA